MDNTLEDQIRYCIIVIQSPEGTKRAYRVFICSTTGLEFVNVPEEHDGWTYSLEIYNDRRSLMMSEYM